MRTLARDFVITLVGSLASAYRGVSSLAVQCSESEKVELALRVVETSKDESYQTEKLEGPGWVCQSHCLCCIS